MPCNIVFTKPGGGVATVTGIVSGDSAAELARLRTNNQVPADWEAVARDVVLPTPHNPAAWSWDGQRVVASE